MEDVERTRIVNRTAQLLGLSQAMANQIVSVFESSFAHPFADKLRSLNIKDIIKNKNPYLYRASGIITCEELVRRAFQDSVSASPEGYFGAFFEGVARIISGGIKPVGGGEVDLDVRSGNTAHLYVIKSGAKGFNDSSRDKAERDLESAERRLWQDRITTRKKIAFAYGRKKSDIKRGIEVLSSNQFWAETSGDQEFYKKLLDVCAELAPLYTADMAAPYEGLLAQAHELFCDDNTVDWDKVLRLVSG